MFERAHRTWTPVMVVLALSALPAAAQKSEAELEEEIEFARGLATEWSFMDLAEDVLRSIESEGVSTKMEGVLAQAKCDMYAAAAVNERDPQRRIELFDEALRAYTQLIDRPGYDQEGVYDYELEAAYVDTAAKYSIALDRSLEEAVGEEATALLARKRKMLEAAIEKVNGFVQELQQVDKTATQQRNLWSIYRNAGKLAADLGAMDDNAYFFTKAQEYLEALVFDALGADSMPNVMLAYIGLGDLFMQMDQAGSAIDYYKSVIDETIPPDPQQWAEIVKQGELTYADKAVRFIFLERGTEGLIKAAIGAGKLDVATRYALHYYNIWKREGFDMSPPGYMSLLACARALLEAGGYVGGNQNAGETVWYETLEEMKAAHSNSREQDEAVSFALRLARTVAEANRGNILQLRSQKLVSDIISRPGVAVSPDVLYDAAEGEYYEENFTAALDGFRRLMRDLDAQDQATRISYGAKVMNGIGNCFRKMERPLESALAFREGCTTWLGDIEFDPKNANGFYRMAQRVQRSATTKIDPIVALVEEAERIVAEAGTRNADEVRFNLGDKAENEQDWDKAINEYQQIPSESDWWERAQAQIGVAKFRKGDVEGALEVFNEYLDVYLKDPKNAEPTSETQSARRREASATAAIYRGLIYSSRAKRSGEPKDHQRVVEALRSFPDDYPSQSQSAPVALKLVVDSQIALGEIDAARSTLDRLIAEHPDAGATGRAAVAFSSALEERLERTEDAQERRTLTRELAQRLERGNAAGGTPPFPNLRKESKYWMDLEEWNKAEQTLKRLVDTFSEDAQRQEELTRYVKPDLGRVLLAQRKLGEAKAVLTPLVTGDGSRAGRATVRLWCYSVAGWLEGSGAAVTHVPGAGGSEEEYQQVIDSLNAIANTFDDKWTQCEWYATQFQMALTYYVWGQQDSRKLDSARPILSIIEGETGRGGTRFGDISQYCSPENEEDPEILGRYGDDGLRDHFRWLAGKL